MNLNNQIWINSSAFHTTETPEMFAIAASLGMNGVELVVNKQVTEVLSDQFSFINPYTFGINEAQWLMNRCNADRMNISISAYNNLMGGSDEMQLRARDILLKLIRAAAMMGGNDNNIKVGTFVGFDHSHPENAFEYNIEKFQKVFAPIIHYAEENNVTILYENCPMEGWNGENSIFTYNNLPSLLAARKIMYALIPSSAHGETYDPSHDIWQQNDPLEILKHTDFKRIHRVHVKSIVIKNTMKNVLWGRVYPAFRLSEKYAGILPPDEYSRWRRFPYEASLPGYDNHSLPDWSKMIALLKDKGFYGPLVIEYGLSLDEAEKHRAIKQCRDYCENILSVKNKFIPYDAKIRQLNNIDYKQLKT